MHTCGVPTSTPGLQKFHSSSTCSILSLRQLLLCPLPSFLPDHSSLHRHTPHCIPLQSLTPSESIHAYPFRSFWRTLWRLVQAHTTNIFVLLVGNKLYSDLQRKCMLMKESIYSWVNVPTYRSIYLRTGESIYMRGIYLRRTLWRLLQSYHSWRPIPHGFLPQWVISSTATYKETGCWQRNQSTGRNQSPRCNLSVRKNQSTRESIYGGINLHRNQSTEESIYGTIYLQGNQSMRRNQSPRCNLSMYAGINLREGIRCSWRRLHLYIALVEDSIM
jgi:hypothetical protein